MEAEHHIKKFEELCAQIVTPNIDPDVLRIKLFPHSLVREATTWYETLPQQDKHWFNMRVAFLEAYGDCSITYAFFQTNGKVNNSSILEKV